MSHVVLYIEDNPQNMRLVRKMLKIGGYDMIEATNGFDGLAVARAQHPDLILVDINLPDIDGTDVTRQLKADDDVAHIPIIALTANAMFGQREQYLEAGCDDYLAKPVSKRELLSMMDKYLA